jgi:hypothetical protein
MERTLILKIIHIRYSSGLWCPAESSKAFVRLYFYRRPVLISSQEVSVWLVQRTRFNGESATSE